MTAVWKNRKGEIIPLSDLSDEHLGNIINFLLRKAPMVRLEELGEAYAFQGTCRGDGAFDAMENEIHRIEVISDEQLLCEKYPTFKLLWKEHQSRQKRKS